MVPALLIVAGYLLGSFPTGVVLGRYVGRDPRKGGSGNIGATNVTRTLGKKWGAVTLLVDVAKGALATWLGLRFGGLVVGLAAGFAAILGHCFPVWLKFAGGKGVATAFGAMVVVAPAVALVDVFIWIGVAIISRIPAVASVGAALAFVVLAHIHLRSFEIQVFSIAVFLVVLIRHRSNLGKLKRRTLAQRAEAARRRRARMR